uniref:Disease resistance RPP13-like protein 1 n=1 Tax=Kalanchoe fedtschenkoi TaxID=63787 RepID=A0A7N0T1D4_KALFE
MKPEQDLGTAFAGVFLSKFAAKDTIDFLLKWSIDELLITKLQTSLMVILGVLGHAELKQIEDVLVKAWLEKVNDAAYDAEDFLDEIATDALESANKPRSEVYEAFKVSDSVKSGIDYKVKEVTDACNPFKETAEKRMRDLIERLEYLGKQIGDFGLKRTEKKSDFIDDERLTNGVARTVTSDIFGRDLDKREILRLLKWKAGDDERVGVISIVGMGGLGKTTLAEIVYNDDKELKDCRFELKAWTCVTDKFDMGRITKDLLNSSTGSVNFEKLLHKKKFLFVLDNVWNKDHNKLISLKNLLSVGKPGSRVIVTTRDQEVANIMSNFPTYNLKELSADDSWSLFEAIAFPHKNSAAFPELIEIGQKILSKCQGLPLAAKSLAGLLLGKGHEKMQWEFILNSELWDIPNLDILPALWISYDHLPMQAKKCFAYCSVFPKGFRFEKEELVFLWMAEDLLPEPASGNNRMEDVGSDCFALLRSRSFLQQWGRDETEFVMHDLIHDLAQFVSGDSSFHLEDHTDQNKISVKHRRMSHFRGANDVWAKFEPIMRLKHMRTFLTLGRSLRLDFDYLSSKVLLGVLLELNKLRVLSLKGYHINVLPDTIGNLRHLRYLNLSHSDIKCLPDAIKSLYNLQTLILMECHSLTKLHADLGSLIRLRHIDTVGTSLQEMPLRMGRLSCLQTLSNFVIGYKVGSGIRELKNLKRLHGKLHISGLQNASVEEAWEALLSDKQYLHKLILEWNSSFCCLVSLRIERCPYCESLPSLGQLRSLKKLVLKELDSVQNVDDRLLGDCGNGSPFRSLQKLKIQEMKNLEIWSIFKRNIAFTSLLELRIFDCPKLVKFSYCFPSLRKLRIERCEQLVGFWTPPAEGSVSDDYQFLQYIILVGCPALKEIVNTVRELKVLHLDGCEELVAFPRLSELRNLNIYDSPAKLIRSLTDLHALEYLEVNNIHQLTELPETFIQQCSKLQELKIFNCWNLVGLASEQEKQVSGFSLLRCIENSCSKLNIFDCWDLIGLENGQERLSGLSSLRSITISGCPYFKSLPDKLVKFAPSLEFLCLKDCDSLSKLPSELCEVIGLQELLLVKCKKLKSFPDTGLPSTLKRLIVLDCSTVTTFQAQMLTNCTSMELMEFERCNKLVSLGDNGQLPSTLKRLKIGFCKNLLQLPQGLSLSANMNLEVLEVSDCDSLTSFPAEDLPTTLKHLAIISCCRLQSLPTGLAKLNYLQHLEVMECPLIENLPNLGLANSNLKSFKMIRCERLKSLPVEFHHISSLVELEISGCPNLIHEAELPRNLTALSINECGKLSVLGLRLHTLRQLQILGISNIPGPITFSAENLLPYSITELLFAGLSDLESLPETLSRLPQLRRLLIRGCHQLRSMPEDGLPSTLGHLEICDCPRVTPSCEPQAGRYWQKISSVPYVQIQ